MKKSRLFSIACCFSLCVLAVQILILRRLLQKEKKETKSDLALVFISKVLNLSFKHNVPLFLIDPKVFRRIQNGSEDELKNCHFLCPSQKILHLATIGPLSTQIQKIAFVEAVEAEGFQLRQFTGSDPVLLQHSLNSPIPLHFIISDELTTIHISVFYERPAKFWWCGGYFPNDKELHDLYELGIRNEDFQMISKTAAFDKVEVHSAAIHKVKIFVPVQQEIFLNYPQNTDFIECNYTQARYFHERYGRDESDEAEIFRSKAFKLLSKAKTLLDNLKIPFWLSSGTCLGFFRECGFISHSKDVDIGIWIKDYKPEIISAFSTHDLPLTHSFGKVEDSFELSFRDNDLKLDIFFFYEEETYVWNGGTQARTGKKFKYVFPKFQLCWTEFLELKVRVPCQTEEYIKANYGPKWFEPIKIWDWKNSPSNVLENGQWPLDEWPEVIQLLPLPDQN
ncbi:fukutin [Trichonephila inaurata madagascariensis]|uniref:Fukutin n=1 Tax=Trichonephila inaurata madagascariensis TaxID=2747483 RepID=A0A8X7C7R2_9ARAC|nr:fukutin [Trichonephila inaurata madagascariensis]